jgi:hypothetical protein
VNNDFRLRNNGAMRIEYSSTDGAIGGGLRKQQGPAEQREQGCHQRSQ